MTEFNAVWYWYDYGHTVIRNASVQLGEGRIYGLLGLNGAGKSTLLKLASGLLFPKRGKVLHNGIDVAERRVETLQDIVFMPSEFDLRKESLEKFVKLNSVFYPRFSREVLDDCLGEFGIDPRTRNLEELSLGNRHKFMLGFLLSLGTGLILLDEPLNGMDLPSRGMFRKLLMRHLRDDQSVVVSTHVMSDVERIVSDVIVLRDDGALSAVRSTPFRAGTASAFRLRRTVPSTARVAPRDTGCSAGTRPEPRATFRWRYCSTP